MITDRYSMEDPQSPPPYDSCVVDTLPCGFKQPMLLFWGALFCLFVALTVYASTFFDLFISRRGPFAFVAFTTSFHRINLTGPLFSLFAGALIVALLYFFSQGTTKLVHRVSSAATTLMYLYLVSLGFSFISLLLKSPSASILMGICSFAVSIAIYVFYYKLGKALRDNYEGEVGKVGVNLLRLFYFILWGIVALIVAYFIVAQIRSLSAIAAIIFVLTGLWFLFIFFFTYFGVYFKMAGVLQRGANNN